MMQSLGYVTVATPGTLVQATINVTNTTAQQPFTRNYYPVHGLLFQAYQGNVGRVYILTKGGDKTTGAGLLAVLAIPAIGSLPAASFTITIAGAALDAAEYYLDVDSASDRALVSVLVI